MQVTYIILSVVLAANVCLYQGSPLERPSWRKLFGHEELPAAAAKKSEDNKFPNFRPLFQIPKFPKIEDIKFPDVNEFKFPEFKFRGFENFKGFKFPNVDAVEFPDFKELKVPKIEPFLGQLKKLSNKFESFTSEVISSQLKHTDDFSNEFMKSINEMKNLFNNQSGQFLEAFNASKVASNFDSLVDPNSIQCTVCKTVTTVIKFEVKLVNASVEEVEKVVKGLCKLYPIASAREACNIIVGEVDQIIQDIENDVAPQDICIKLKLCSNSTNSTENLITTAIKKVGDTLEQTTTAVLNPDAVSCSTCKVTMTTLNTMKMIGLTPDEKQLGIGCQFLTGETKKQCLAMVEKVLKGFKGDNVNPEEACKKIKMCNNDTPNTFGFFKHKVSVSLPSATKTNEERIRKRATNKL